MDVTAKPIPTHSTINEISPKVDNPPVIYVPLEKDALPNISPQRVVVYSPLHCIIPGKTMVDKRAIKPTMLKIIAERLVLIGFVGAQTCF